jgi:hypothetical protein
MGNCTGVFQTCCGQEGGDTIKKIDRDNMQKAMQSKVEYNSNYLIEGGDSE